jgi:hypothetical protein
MNVEFVHEFSSEETIRAELEEGGLSVLRFVTDPASIRGSAVCQKPPTRTRTPDHKENLG